MEKYKKGGYTILDLESSTIYADSVKALDSNKPVVVYDGTNKPYFADTISLSGTSVVITKGGKTITIANDNTITNVGDIQNHLYCYNFEDDNDLSNIKVYSTINCDITNTDEGPFTQSQLKSLFDLFDDVSNGPDVKGYDALIYIDSGNLQGVNAIIRNHKFTMTNLNTNTTMVDVVLNKDSEGVYSLNNNTGYLYISKRQIF